VTTNNQAKALTSYQGLIILKALEIKNNLIFGDSSLVIGQVRKEDPGNFSPISRSIVQIKGIVQCFESIDLLHIFCSCNTHTDVMENKVVNLDKGVLVKNGGETATCLIP